jgi:HEAT repeat protein
MIEFDVSRARSLLGDPDEEVRRRAVAEIPEGWTAGALAVLIDALGDDSWRVRKDAVVRVARWPDPDGAVPMLIATLADDSNVGLRNAAVEALTAIGAPSVAPLTLALAAGGEHRKFLVDALGAIGDRSAVPALVRALDDPDENVRAAAAESLGNLGGPYAVEALRHRLTAAPPASSGQELIGRLAALQALTRLAAPVPVAELLPLCADPILRIGALEAMGYAGDLDALPYLLDGLADKGRQVREASQVALLALHEAQTANDARLRIESSVRAAPAAVEGLTASCVAEPARTRRAAVTLLGWGRWPEGLPRLVDALADEEIHATAARAIVAFGAAAVAPLVEIAQETRQDLRSEIFGLFPRLGAAAADARVAALLMRALEDEDAIAAAAAARALGDVGSKDSLGPLFHSLERNDDPMVPQAASQALAKLGARYYDEVRMLVGARGIHGEVGVYLCRVVGAVGRAEDRPMLLAALRGDEASLRRAAAEAVATLGPAPEAREALVYALADEDARVRAAAADALGALGDIEAVPALISASHDDESSVRAAAARSLGLVGDARAAPTLRELARGGDGAIAMHALEALGRLRDKDPADEHLLVEALRRRDPEVVKAAVRALSGRTTASATAGLRQALDHSRWDVRRLAAQALAGRIVHDVTALEALRARARIETDTLVRDTIEAAIAGVG